MIRLKQLIKRTNYFVLAICLFATWVVGDAALFANNASAAQIVTRSLTLSSSASGDVTDGNAGEGGNGAQATHTFTFTEGTSGADIGSIEFLYCTTPLPSTTCTAPTGMDASTVTSVDGLTASEWTFDSATTNSIQMTRSGGVSAITNNQELTFGAGSTGTDYIKNPTTENEEFFVRITTFSDATYTTEEDQGTVASAVAQQIDITAKVQEVLNFSVAGDESAPDDPQGTQCDPLTGSGAVGLGDTDDVLSFSTAYDAHSYFRVSTNATNGTSVSYSGDTLSLVGSGGATQIAPADDTTPEASDVGTEQFGLAIDSGDTIPDGFTFNSLAAQTPYDQGDGTIVDSGTALFAFDTGSVTAPVEIATSVGEPTETIVCDTGSVRYLGNVSTTTSAGIYTTTITYIAAPEF